MTKEIQERNMKEQNTVQIEHIKPQEDTMQMVTLKEEREMDFKTGSR